MIINITNIFKLRTFFIFFLLPVISIQKQNIFLNNIQYIVLCFMIEKQNCLLITAVDLYSSTFWNNTALVLQFLYMCYLFPVLISRIFSSIQNTEGSIIYFFLYLSNKKINTFIITSRQFNYHSAPKLPKLDRQMKNLPSFNSKIKLQFERSYKRSTSYVSIFISFYSFVGQS